MKSLITVREYAKLTIAPVTPSLDCAQVSASAFDYLCELSASFSKSGANLLQIEGRRSLKLDNYVGVLETPCGTRLEILPKHLDKGDCVKKSRAMLRKMIQAALNVKPRQVGVAELELYDAPLSEWVMQQFLGALDQLIKRGMRFDYLRIEEEQRYLRGQLNVVAQMRQPFGRQHQFQIRHDVFLPDRAENRLLKLALERVCQATKDADNWRLAQSLHHLLLDVPKSRDQDADFKAWRNDRLMAHYQHVKPWCELILYQQMPHAVAGEWRGISLLFPMQVLFERYVVAWLRSALHPDATLKAPAASEYLCQHGGSKIFQLKPDMLVNHQQQRWILDAKWKRLEALNRKGNYKLSEQDFYQMLAYAHKYLKGEGEILLIYPKWAQFESALPPFDFGDGLTLYVLPFDLENVSLLDVGLSQLPVTQNDGKRIHADAA